MRPSALIGVIATLCFVFVSPGLAVVHQNRGIDSLSVSAGPTPSEMTVYVMLTTDTDSTFDANDLSCQIVFTLDDAAYDSSGYIPFAADHADDPENLLCDPGCATGPCNTWSHATVQQKCFDNLETGGCDCRGYSPFAFAMAKPVSGGLFRATLVAWPGSQPEEFTGDDSRVLTLGPVGVPEPPAGGAASLRLDKNPMRPGDWLGIDFTLPASARTQLRVVDVSGSTVQSLVESELGPGDHRATWSGMAGTRRAPAGVYFLVLTSGALERSAKVVVLQ